jgi:hypothetical protein
VSLHGVHPDRLAKEAAMTSRTHRLVRTATVTVAAVALAAPAAGARPAGPDPVSSGAEAPPPVVQSIDEGFDPASAAIGAGGAGALILLAWVGGATYRHRHRRIAEDHVSVAR